MIRMYSYLLVAVVSATTILIRFLPFILFKEKTPSFILYLGKTLPYCAMAMLVVFCYRNVSFQSVNSFLPQLLSGVLAVILYKWKHSTSLAIVVSTIVYMLLIQQVFR